MKKVLRIELSEEQHLQFKQIKRLSGKNFKTAFIEKMASEERKLRKKGITL